jgi:hypothetical protein
MQSCAANRGPASDNAATGEEKGRGKKEIKKEEREKEMKKEERKKKEKRKGQIKKKKMKVRKHIGYKKEVYYIFLRNCES